MAWSSLQCRTPLRPHSPLCVPSLRLSTPRHWHRAFSFPRAWARTYPVCLKGLTRSNANDLQCWCKVWCVMCVCVYRCLCFSSSLLSEQQKQLLAEHQQQQQQLQQFLNSQNFTPVMTLCWSLLLTCISTSFFIDLQHFCPFYTLLIWTSILFTSLWPPLIYTQLRKK